MIKLKRAYDRSPRPMAGASWSNDCGRAVSRRRNSTSMAGSRRSVPAPHCASGSATIRKGGTRSARATPANSARGPEAWQPIVSAARRGTVTLIYSSHDPEHNNAVALQQYLRAKVRRRTTPVRTVARLRRSRQ
jgi:hypothetical protein